MNTTIFEISEKEPEALYVIWLGQSGYIFEYKGRRLVIDPFLSDIVLKKQGIERLMPPPVAVDGLFPDYVFITHDHLDHFDPETMPVLHKLYPDCLVIGPESVVKHAIVLNFNEEVIREIRPGDVIAPGDFELSVLPAWHSDPFAVGLILKAGNTTCYISGDTLFNEELVPAIDRQVDVVFIVINGKLGNMNVQEAVRVVEQLRPSLAIPMHYGMFAGNTEDPQVFLEGCAVAGIEAITLLPGKPTIVRHKKTARY